MFLLSLIPVPFLYLAPLILTGIVTGIALYVPFMTDVKGKFSFLEAVVYLIPHGILEIFGFLVMAATIYCLNKKIMSKLYKKVPNMEMNLVQVINGVGKIYLSIGLPCLVVAAAIEAYITPLLIK